MSGYTSVFREQLFRDRVCVITGGGSGIGRCTAHELASLGARVVVIGRKQGKLERTCEELRTSYGVEATLHALDIRDEAAVVQAITQVVARHGRIDALVNNAGGQYAAPLATISKRGFEAVVATNLTGGFLVAREVFTQSMREHGGAIVNIVADMWNGMPGMAHSGAARAGMVNLTKTAAFEWGPFKVRVNAVAPGYVQSSGLEHYGPETRALFPQIPAQVPLRRLATEAEISAAICFLLSPAAAFINGATLAVDGGAPLGTPLYPKLLGEPTPAFAGFTHEED